MIRITKILSETKETEIGIGITIDKNDYFIFVDQIFYPGIRLGKHPRFSFGGDGEYKTLSYPEKKIISINTKGITEYYKYQN